ncbi:hypothetical protein DFQ01_11012 [Paenibacillus cellulosilyticus]|uniref:Transposase IS66 family protein n=1 Tax=Paenibacillus cellulosilyticus TaxID=375489 RepID=A0A2V2YS79_9BACL|nr:hypothetical protein DFQ01_11012 [Paenibacillus cellulosilyticus]
MLLPKNRITPKEKIYFRPEFEHCLHCGESSREVIQPGKRTSRPFMRLSKYGAWIMHALIQIATIKIPTTNLEKWNRL